MSLSSLSMATSLSPVARGPVAAVPPRPAALPAEPVVPDDPDELAVPRLLVPGAAGTPPEFPMPFGLTELFRPALGELDGGPIVPAAPGVFPKPALGEPVALPIPDVVPVAEVPLAGLAIPELFSAPAAPEVAPLAPVLPVAVEA